MNAKSVNHLLVKQVAGVCRELRSQDVRQDTSLRDTTLEPQENCISKAPEHPAEGFIVSLQDPVVPVTAQTSHSPSCSFIHIISII